MTILLARHEAGRAAVVDTAQRAETTWGSLLEQVSSTAQLLRRETGVGLVSLVTAHTAESIVVYLACLEARCPVCLI